MSDCIPGLCSIPVRPGPPIPGIAVELDEVEEVVVVVLVVLLAAVFAVVVVGVVPEGLVVVVVVVEEPRGAQGFGRGSLFSRPACALSTGRGIVRHCIRWHCSHMTL